MSKKIFIWTLITIVIFSIFFIIHELLGKQNQTKISNDNYKNGLEISQTNEGVFSEVTDECAKEWEDYNKYIGEKIEEASSRNVEDKTHYLLKDVLGYIEVYYLDDNNHEYLYKKTTISTAYLTQEDIDDLKIGIEVVGTEAMNKMLEDFE